MDLQAKLPDTSIEIHELLAKRWSPRAFADKRVETRELQKLFEAARWAPSSSNNQPWRFLLGIKGENDTWQKVFDCLDDGNQRWCKDAPVLILAVGYTLTARGNANGWFSHDVGQAMAHLTFQAMSQNLYVHQMAGFYKDIAREKFNIPVEAEPFTCAVIGYLGEPETLPEDLAKREAEPRKRKELSEIVFEDEYGKAFDF